MVKCDVTLLFYIKACEQALFLGGGGGGGGESSEYVASTADKMKRSKLLVNLPKRSQDNFQRFLHCPPHSTLLRFLS